LRKETCSHFSNFIFSEEISWRLKNANNNIQIIEGPSTKNKVVLLATLPWAHEWWFVNCGGVSVSISAAVSSFCLTCRRKQFRLYLMRAKGSHVWCEPTVPRARADMAMAIYCFDQSKWVPVRKKIEIVANNIGSGFFIWPGAEKRDPLFSNPVKFGFSGWPLACGAHLEWSFPCATSACRTICIGAVITA
jgi:hypothetical protein